MVFKAGPPFGVFRNLLPENQTKNKEGELSSSSAIRLSPSQIRTCGFPASGSSRGLPKSALQFSAGVCDPRLREWKTRVEKGIELLPIPPIFLTSTSQPFDPGLEHLMAKDL